MTSLKYNTSNLQVSGNNSRWAWDAGSLLLPQKNSIDIRKTHNFVVENTDASLASINILNKLETIGRT